MMGKIVICKMMMSKIVGMSQRFQIGKVSTTLYDLVRKKWVAFSPATVRSILNPK